MPTKLKHRILIVDDEESIRDGLKTFFESEGYKVDVAEDALISRMMIEKNRPVYSSQSRSPHWFR